MLLIFNTAALPDTSRCQCWNMKHFYSGQAAVADDQQGPTYQSCSHDNQFPGLTHLCTICNHQRLRPCKQLFNIHQTFQCSLSHVIRNELTGKLQWSSTVQFWTLFYIIFCHTHCISHMQMLSSLSPSVTP